MKKILVVIDDKEEGPLGINELNKQILESKIKSSDIAWSSGMKEWLPLSDSRFLEMGVEFPDEIHVQDNILSEKGNHGAIAVQLPLITVVSGDQEFSGLSVQELNEKLQDNIFQQEDLAWFKGLKDWLPLSSMEFETIGVNHSVGKIVKKPKTVPKVKQSLKPTKFSSSDGQIDSTNTSGTNGLIKIYKENWLFYSLGVILSGIPVLGFIFLFNYINLIIKHLKTNSNLSLGDILSFDNWVGKVLFGCIFTICLLFSFSLLLIPGIILFTYFIYSIHIFAENKIPIKQALKESLTLVRGNFKKHAISNIIILILIITPSLIPTLVFSLVQVPFLNLILMPLPFLLLVLLPLIHIHLCRNYISINNQNIDSSIATTKKENARSVKDGKFATKLSEVLTEIDKLRPLLSQCGFILGNIKFIASIPPSVSFSLEQKIQGKKDIENVLSNEKIPKFQRKILQSIQNIYKVDDVVQRHNMTIGMIEVEIGIVPKIISHLYSTESRSFKNK